MLNEPKTVLQRKSLISQKLLVQWDCPFCTVPDNLCLRQLNQLEYVPIELGIFTVSRLILVGSQLC